MKAIVISEKRLDALFEKCLDKLNIEKFNMAKGEETENMHRAFHYWVCLLKDEIKKDEA